MGFVILHHISSIYLKCFTLNFVNYAGKTFWANRTLIDQLVFRHQTFPLDQRRHQFGGNYRQNKYFGKKSTKKNIIETCLTTSFHICQEKWFKRYFALLFGFFFTFMLSSLDTILSCVRQSICPSNRPDNRPSVCLSVI